MLLILAGITINLLFNDDGIIKKAGEAANKTNEAIQEEQQGLQNLANLLNEYTNGGTVTPEIKELTTLTEIQTETIKAKDAQGNIVTVPKGFKVTTDGATVQDGIVIEDKDGNQFVWIPVGTVKNTDGSTNTIKLGRYSFGTDGTPSENTNTSYKELDNTDTTYDNTKSVNIEEFKKSAVNNGGYYLGRYEASYRSGTTQNDYIPYCTPSEGTLATSLPTTYSVKQLWNFITQPNAANACRNMYKDNNNVISDLVNSYAWDTALVYIQTYSGDTDYSKKEGVAISSNLSNTGVNDDRVCNINNMAGNEFEWSTETYLNNSNHSVVRGGAANSGNSSGGRFNKNTSYNGATISFRPILYIK